MFFIIQNLDLDKTQSPGISCMVELTTPRAGKAIPAGFLRALKTGPVGLRTGGNSMEKDRQEG
jgi:hypothetical protein